MDSAHSARHLGIRHYLDRLRETRQGLDPPPSQGEEGKPPDPGGALAQVY